MTEQGKYLKSRTPEQLTYEFGKPLTITEVIQGAAELAKAWGARLTLCIPDEWGKIHTVRGLRAFDLAAAAK